MYSKKLHSIGCINISDVVNAADGFWMICKSLSDMLAEERILDFPSSNDSRLACENFFDDCFLYPVPNKSDYTYSLLKFREQEHDVEDGTPADGDTHSVTISFIQEINQKSGYVI